MLIINAAGDLLRAEVAAGSKNGNLAKEYMEKGQLLRNEIVVMVDGQISQQDSEEKGWLLDGYPRSTSQANALKDYGFDLDIFILLEVDGGLPKHEVVSQIDSDLAMLLEQKLAPSGSVAA